MSKINIPAVPSGFASTTALNERFQQIEDEFNNKVLYRPDVGAEPNAMSDDLDMGDNQIINVQAGVANTDAVNVGQISDLIAEAAASIGPADGNVLGPVSSVDNEVALFSGITGRVLKRGLSFWRFLTNAATYSDLTNTPATIGQIVFIRCHTSGSVGGGAFQAFSGSVTNDGGTQCNSATANIYWKRMDQYELDPYMFGATGSQTPDTTAIASALSVLKTNGRGGILKIPSSINKLATVPDLGLSNNYAVSVIDYRIDIIGPFGIESHYIEGRDNNGGYATELRVKGKQNPNISLQSLSDGTAYGYRTNVPNNMAGLSTYKRNGDTTFQFLADPLASGVVGDFGLLQYATGPISAQFAVYYGIDGDSKTRTDMNPSQLSTSTIAITNISNTTPIVVTLATNHGIVPTRSYVDISGTGLTGANGSWRVSVTGVNQITLLNSVAAGTSSTGSCIVTPNAQRATLTLSKPSSASESLFVEGVIGSNVASGTAPIVVQSQKADINLHARPYTLDLNGTQRTNGTVGSGGSKIVSGAVTLSGGSATVNLTGDSVFTSNLTYFIAGANLTSTNSFKFTRVSASQFTVTGTGTDQISFIISGY